MDSSAKTDTVPKFNSHFCIKMVNQVLLAEINKGSNLVLSPLSFHVMLSLIAVGSTGRTLKQLLFHLGSESVQDLNSGSSQILDVTSTLTANENHHAADPLVSFISGAWVDQTFSLKLSFAGILNSVYKAKAEEADFGNKADQVIDEVNTWAETASNGLIKKLLPSGSIDSDTALVFANALYFKGAWDWKFDATRTTCKEFHLLNGQIVQVPFMTTEKNQRHQYRYFKTYRVLKIPYQNGLDSRQFSMYFFLPEKIDGLKDLVREFNSTPDFFNRDFQFSEMELPQFWIPRFKFSFEFEASATMKELGLKLPFMDVGEFTELVDSPHGDNFSVSKIFHKSYIEVNEEGTEAAASTAVRFRKCCAYRPTPSFVADHPFMFMIRENTSGIVFFTGVVLNPLLT